MIQRRCRSEGDFVKNEFRTSNKCRASTDCRTSSFEGYIYEGDFVKKEWLTSKECRTSNKCLTFNDGRTTRLERCIYDQKNSVRRWSVGGFSDFENNRRRWSVGHIEGKDIRTCRSREEDFVEQDAGVKARSVDNGKKRNRGAPCYTEKRLQVRNDVTLKLMKCLEAARERMDTQTLLEIKRLQTGREYWKRL